MTDEQNKILDDFAYLLDKVGTQAVMLEFLARYPGFYIEVNHVVQGKKIPRVASLLKKNAPPG